MELIVFVGIQGSGKSSFYQKQFADTHIRLNLDMLRTRHREEILFDACLKAKQPVVIDNTNLTVERRAMYLGLARVHRFKTVAYYFDKSVTECLANNKKRNGKAQVPDIALFASARNIEIPTTEEGFDEVNVIK
jgi:predicted kinase